MRAVRLAAMAAYQALYGRRATTRLAEGWRQMRLAPEVVRDLCVLGHLYEPDVDPATGRIYPADELIARSARKTMALALLARAEITHEELNILRQEGFNDAAGDDAFGQDD